MLNRQQLSKYFKKVRKGGKGYYLICPFCGHDEAGIINGKDQVFNCFRKKHCGAKGEVNYILKRLGFKEEEPISLDSKLEGFEKEEEKEVSLKEISLPLGAKRVWHDAYLISRGFSKQVFEKYEITKTDLDLRFKDYIIISIFQGNKRVGYLARYLGNDENKPKYKNSENDFEYILGGIDETAKNTKTVILVEGLFDKVSIDNKLELNEDESVKCCCTFGAKISERQINLLIEKGVENILLFFDNDVLNTNKSVGNLLYLRFNSVRVVDYEGDEDPNEMDRRKLINVLDNRTKNVFEYLTLL